ncbi:hypothetical protein F5B17DRAFT_191802 [Nemania serpens]|nr:hypothetical protein F5B17DRAFT_191802 [Nemania serpens]
MTTEETLRAREGHRDAEPSTSRDPAIQQTSELHEVSNTDRAPPPLPQRPASIRNQVLPQPFYGQQQPIYVPYAGQPNQQFTYVTPVRPLPKQSSAYIATRLGLTALASVWGIIIIALTSILLSDGGIVSFVSLYAYAIVVASIIWNTAELITYCVRLRKQTQRGIHPGAHVALYLVFWLVGVFALILSVALYVGAEYDVRRCENRSNDDSSTDPYYLNSFCDDFEPMDYYKWNVLPTIRAFLAILALWLINHFVLFVLACIDTHKRNAMKPAAFVMPVTGQNAVVPVQGVYYPQQGGPQPMQYYPYPVMMQPQPTHLAGAQSQAPVTNEKQPAQANQPLSGFYAPVPGPSAHASPSAADAVAPAENAISA